MDYVDYEFMLEEGNYKTCELHRKSLQLATNLDLAGLECNEEKCSATCPLNPK